MVALFVQQSTNKENEYPRFIKIQVINSVTSKNIERFVSKYIVLGKERKLNRESKFSYDCLKDRIQVNNQKVNYEETEHRLLWLNIVIGNIPWCNQKRSAIIFKRTRMAI